MARRKGRYSVYEKMFEDLLRTHHVPYIAIDEQRRPVTPVGTIKNFDFFVHSRTGNYLADIKGKMFPQESVDGKNKLWWQNWVHESDIRGLAFWKNVFGGSFTPLIIFTYQILYMDNIFQFWDLYNYEKYPYGLVACTFDDYCQHAVVRSEKWKAFSVNREDFQKIIRPLRVFIPEISPDESHRDL